MRMCVRVVGWGGVRNYNVLVGEGRGESKDYVILLYQR